MGAHIVSAAWRERRRDDRAWKLATIGLISARITLTDRDTPRRPSRASGKEDAP